MKVSRNGTGNVHPTPEDVAAEEEVPEVAEDVVKAGDFVKLTAAAIKMERLSRMTPRLLYKLGHPGIFQIACVFETDQDGVCYALSDCCLYYLSNREKATYRCKGHPAIFFERAKVAPTPETPEKRKKGDKSSSVSLPFLGEVAAMDFDEDEKHPTLSVNIAGKTFVMTGQMAKIFGKAAQDNHLL